MIRRHDEGEPMKVGIIGANGQVGTELAFLFREQDLEVVPIVRNSIAGSLFEHHGFEYRLADVSHPEDAQRVLSDIDLIVIAAFASPVSRGDYKPKRARQANEAMIKNSVQYAPANATVVYFSSVTAFGKQMGISEHWWYVREKRHLEEILFDSCNSYDKVGYVFRIGLVLGQNLDRTQAIETTLSRSTRVDVEAHAAANSNTVHTVTIAESVLQCFDDGVSPGTYTVVNRPQWTWERVFDFYGDGNTEIRFVGSQSSPPLYTRLVSPLFSYISDRQTELMSLTYYLPDAFNQFIFNTYMKRDISSDINEYENRFRFHRREFDYREAPGPFLQDKRTTDLLDKYGYPQIININRQ